MLFRSELFQEGYEIFALYLDDTTAELEEEAEIDAYEGMLGVDRETWESFKNEEMELENKTYENGSLIIIYAINIMTGVATSTLFIRLSLASS